MKIIPRTCVNAAFNWQWQDSVWTLQLSFLPALSYWVMAVISAKEMVLTFFFPPLRKEFLITCCFHLPWERGWMRKGTRDTVIYIDLHGRGLFRWKWLWLPLSFCKCRMDKTTYNEHVCEPFYFWPLCSSLLLHIFFPPLWLLPLPHVISSLSLFPHSSLMLWPRQLFIHYLLSPSASVTLLCRFSSHPSVPYHYYEPRGPDECFMYLFHENSRQGGHHRFITEKAVFANWARTLNISFHQPDWKPMAAISGSNSSHTLFQRGPWDSDQRRGCVLQLINRASGATLLLLLTCCIISLAVLDQQHKSQTKAHVSGV